MKNYIAGFRSNNSKKKKNDDLKIIGEVKPFRPKINL